MNFHNATKLSQNLPAHNAQRTHTTCRAYIESVCLRSFMKKMVVAPEMQTTESSIQLPPDTHSTRRALVWWVARGHEVRGCWKISATQFHRSTEHWQMITEKRNAANYFTSQGVRRSILIYSSTFRLRPEYEEKATPFLIGCNLLCQLLAKHRRKWIVIFSENWNSIFFVFIYRANR